MNRESTKAVAQHALSTIIGLPLTIAREAADMTVFHFGEIRPHHTGRGTVGSYALHVQCSWRFVDATGIVTGYSDRFSPPDENSEVDPDDWRAGNLQRLRLWELMGTFDEATNSPIDQTGKFIVTSVVSDQYAGLNIELSGGLLLQVFTDGSSEEAWRFFRCGDICSHLVIAGGRIETE